MLCPMGEPVFFRGPGADSPGDDGFLRWQYTPAGPEARTPHSNWGPQGIEIPAADELHHVRSLRILSDNRLRLLQETGESDRVERRWNRLLILRESELAAVVATTLAARGKPPS
jgi:hypothetical protein